MSRSKSAITSGSVSSDALSVAAPSSPPSTGPARMGRWGRTRKSLDTALAGGTAGVDKDSAGAAGSGGGASTAAVKSSGLHVDIMAKLFGHMKLEERGSNNEEDSELTCLERSIRHPLSKTCMYWDVWMALLILWTAMEVPFTIAFVAVPPSKTSIAIDVTNAIIDGFFFVDIAVSFTTGYIDHDDAVTMEPRLIFWHYVRGWFFVDLISAFPFDACVEAAANDSSEQLTSQMLSAISMLKLLRLLRLHKLLRYFRLWGDDLGLITASSTILAQMSLLFCSVLLFIHLNACIQFIVPLVNDFPHDSWPRLLGTNGVTDCCVVLIAQNASGATLSEARWSCYSNAYFQAMSQMLCIGFGLVNPKRTDELWVTMISMLLGASVYAVSLAFAVNVFSNVDHPSRLYKNAEEVLHEFMRVRSIPPPLRERLRVYFQHLYPNRRVFHEGEVVGQFSYSLRGEVQMSRCAKLFQSTPIFEGADPALTSAIAPLLHLETAMPGDCLAREGEYLNFVTFIEYGKVDVLVDGKHVAEMGDGSYMGEIAALGLAGSGASPREGVASATPPSAEVARKPVSSR